MKANPKSNRTWIAGLITAIVASLCCITPVLALLGGLGGIASSFSWLEPFRPYLLGFTVIVFGFAWYQKLKPKNTDIECDCEEEKQSFWQSKTFLAIVTTIAGLLLTFPYYAHLFYPKPQQSKIIVIDKANIEQVKLNIEGMTCQGCEEHISNELSKLNGVIENKTSYKEGTSTVTFNRSVTNIDSIINVVNRTGYTVKEK
ncbi:MAG: mercuric transport protein MerTP [Bacteroidia bacterium]